MSDNAGYPCNSCAGLEQRNAELEREAAHLAANQCEHQDKMHDAWGHTFCPMEREVERLQGIISDERCKAELLSEQACDLARAEGRAEGRREAFAEASSRVRVLALANTEKEASDGDAE